MLVLSKNKINFETNLKDTTSSVIINLKICDSAEKLNLEKLNISLNLFFGHKHSFECQIVQTKIQQSSIQYDGTMGQSSDGPINDQLIKNSLRIRIKFQENQQSTVQRQSCEHDKIFVL